MLAGAWLLGLHSKYQKIGGRRDSMDMRLTSKGSEAAAEWRERNSGSTG